MGLICLHEMTATKRHGRQLALAFGANVKDPLNRTRRLVRVPESPAIYLRYLQGTLNDHKHGAQGAPTLALPGISGSVNTFYTHQVRATSKRRGRNPPERLSAPITRPYQGIGFKQLSCAFNQR